MVDQIYKVYYKKIQELSLAENYVPVTMTFKEILNDKGIKCEIVEGFESVFDSFYSSRCWIRVEGRDYPIYQDNSIPRTLYTKEPITYQKLEDDDLKKNRILLKIYLKSPEQAWKSLPANIQLLFRTIKSSF